ncbi:hypothetical protein D3C73_969530 [compost metagenome]
MVVSTAGHKVKAFADERFGQYFSVFHNVFCICFKRRLQCFTKSYCFGSDHVHKWSTLCTREYRFIDSCCPRLTAQNHTAARSAKCFVSCCSYKMRMWNWAWVKTRSNQTCDMSHIHHEESTYIVSDGSKLFKVDDTWVSTCTSNDHTRTMLECCFANFVIINTEGIFLHTISYEIIEKTGCINWTTMSQVTTMC